MEVTLELQFQISLSLNEGFPTRIFNEMFFFLMLPSSFVNHSKSDRHIKKNSYGQSVFMS